ncbi:MAG: GNAT family N-acetyltransferase [Planctomycetes bacterium]|nr:GNAT family N-acetyltransferase [Planctomycetota bacterium]
MNIAAGTPPTQEASVTDVYPVRSSRDLDIFIRLPWTLYRGDPNWVPPLIASERKLLDRARNPFWSRAESEHFLAWRDDICVGRISAIVNHPHNEAHGEKSGWFGFFESEQNPRTVKALLETAEGWLRSKGMTRILGPANPSLNDTAGMLVEGFKWSPFVLMTYNPPHYPALVEACGYTKAMDLFAYIMIQNDLVREKIDRVAGEVQARKEVQIRMVDLSRFEEELRLVMDIYNDAWLKNWGFVPMTEAEIRFVADDMRSIVLPEFVYFAYYKGEPVGFSLALPDINHALKRANGRLFPFGWFYFLRPSLRRIPAIRIVALGVKRNFHHLGIGTLFYKKYMEEGLKRGYKAAELSWILENNDLMNRPVQQMGAKPYKKYRIYEKGL